ncbi:MAG: hypothetical protein MJB57_15785 [Gemmatimonadetes bacterium]|nr:hypothetical protein [Gemmatimonadota bacterium]
MAEIDQLPELYTQRELDKARRRQRLLGRAEGVGGVIVAGAVFNLLGWIPTVLVVAVVGYVLFKLVSKSKKTDEDGEE